MEYSYKHGETLQQGEEIRQFQEKLNAVRTAYHGNWESLVTDGIYGRRTRNAVRGFQQYINISVTGNLDSNTQLALNQQYLELLSRPPMSQEYYYSSNPTYSSADPTYSSTGRYTNRGSKLNHNKAEDVDTSSWVDTEWKSVARDIMEIVSTVSETITPDALKSEAYLRNFIEKEVRNHYSEIRSLQTKLAKIRASKMPPVSEVYRTYGNGRSLVTKNLADETTDALKRGLKEANSKFEKLSSQADDIAKKYGHGNHEEALKKTEKIGKYAPKVAKGLTISKYVFDVAVMVYYGVNMGIAESTEEKEQYKGKLIDSTGSAAVDIGIGLGTNVAIRLATGASGGPAGIVAVTLLTVVDIALVATGNQSVSTTIWNFLKQVNWSTFFIETYTFHGIKGHISKT